MRNLTPLLSARFEGSQGKCMLNVLAHESQKELLGSLPEEIVYWIRGERPTGWRRLAWEHRNLQRIVDEIGVDVLFTPYQIGPPVTGVKQVLMLRNMEPFLFGQYPYSWDTALRNRLVARSSCKSLNHADRVIAVSGFARDYLVNEVGVAPGCVRTIYHGRTQAVAEKAPGSQALLAEIGVDGRFILTCGSLLPYRRCEDVIQAFDIAVTNLPDGMQLVVAGSGTDQRYDSLIREAVKAASASSRILLAGHVTWDKMAALYRYSDACVIATEIEACPNIAIEAMAAGCAVIANDKPPLPEMFDNAYHPYRARDVQHLAETMGQVVGNEELGTSLRTLALQRAEFFSWEKCADETYAALTDWP